MSQIYSIPTVFPNNATFEGQASSPEDTEVGSGTAHTIDFNDGNSTVLDLEQFSGDVTLTLSNPRSGASYIIKVLQGSVARNLIWPGNVLWPSGTPPIISTANDTLDVISLYYDGVNFLGLFGQDFL